MLSLIYGPMFLMQMSKPVIIQKDIYYRITECIRLKCVHHFKCYEKALSNIQYLLELMYPDIASIYDNLLNANTHICYSHVPRLRYSMRNVGFVTRHECVFTPRSIRDQTRSVWNIIFATHVTVLQLFIIIWTKYLNDVHLASPLLSTYFPCSPAFLQ